MTRTWPEIWLPRLEACVRPCDVRGTSACCVSWSPPTGRAMRCSPRSPTAAAGRALPPAIPPDTPQPSESVARSLWRPPDCEPAPGIAHLPLLSLHTRQRPPRLSRSTLVARSVAADAGRAAAASQAGTHSLQRSRHPSWRQPPACFPGVDALRDALSFAAAPARRKHPAGRRGA